ncbi:MAG: hypothetical protein R6X13_06485 [bacterium]
MKGALLCVAGLAVAAQAMPSGLTLQYGDRPPRPRLAAIAVETGTSLLGGVLLGGGTAVLVFAGIAAGEDLGLHEERLMEAMAIAYTTGFGGAIVGSGVGAWAGGRMLKEDGRFGGAMLGALCGSVASLGLVFAAPENSPLAGIMWATAAVTPFAGSVIGYNLSRPCTGCGMTRRMLLPELGVALTEDAAGRPAAAPRLQLVGFAI